MGIFDQPRRQLNPMIFSPDEKVLPEVKSYILELLSSFFPQDKLYSLVLQGSNTTHQYSGDSDVDVQVMATKTEDFDTWHPVFKQFNKTDHFLPGTVHPVNFFFVEYVDPTKIIRGWQRSLGAYDLLSDQWLKRPTPFEKILDPEIEYAAEISYVNMLMKMIESEVHAIRQAVADGDQSKALSSLRTLQRFFRHIDEESKSSYRWGGGIPNKEEDHVIYKLLRRGPYGKLLEDLING
jgi:hypothetical protein